MGTYAHTHDLASNFWQVALATHLPTEDDDLIGLMRGMLSGPRRASPEAREIAALRGEVLALRSTVETLTASVEELKACIAGQAAMVLEPADLGLDSEAPDYSGWRISADDIAAMVSGDG